MAMKKNFWTSDMKYALFDFGIEFDRDFEIEEHFSFVEEYLHMTNKYSICKIDIDGQDGDFLNHLKYEWDVRGRFVPSYLPGYKYYSYQFPYPFTALSFYEKDKIVQKDVCLIANKSYNPSYVYLTKQGSYYLYNLKNIKHPYWIEKKLAPPISLGLRCAVKGKKIAHNDIVGYVKNDIWLDTVLGLKLYNEEGSNYELSEERDNTELALLNTPRLNSFLRDLRKLGLKFGGRWFMEANIEIINEHAIPIKGEVLYYDE